VEDAHEHLKFTSSLFGASIFAGLLGALTGLGGGVVIVPALVLLFKVDIRYAIGASLVSVIATSSGAAVAYVREGLSNSLDSHRQASSEAVILARNDHDTLGTTGLC
jgi:uncharacterized membrane protein YfcA